MATRENLMMIFRLVVILLGILTVLAIKKVNACVWLVLDGQEEHWEAWVQEIPIPCQ